MATRIRTGAGPFSRPECLIEAEASVGGRWCSPVVHRPVTTTIDWQVLGFVRELGGGLRVETHASAGLITRVHVAVTEGVAGGEQLAGRIPVTHVLLDAEVRDAEVDVQRGGHSDR